MLSLPDHNLPFRVFISYSHNDRSLAEKLHDILKKQKMQPIWDKHICPGYQFTDEIEYMIVHSHMFIPLITVNSEKRP